MLDVTTVKSPARKLTAEHYSKVRRKQGTFLTSAKMATSTSINILISGCGLLPVILLYALLN